jgi:hypothetical protein
MEAIKRLVKRHRKTRWLELAFCVGLIATYFINIFHEFIPENLSVFWMIIGAVGLGTLCRKWNGTREQRFIVRLLNTIKQESANK